MANRYIISLFISIATLASLSSAHAGLRVFACEPEWAALTKALGGEKLTIYSATTAQQDPHHIQARPSLIAKARRADLIVCTGAELEIGWLPLLLRKSGNSKIRSGKPGHFMASDYVRLLEKPEVLDRSMGDIHEAGNPHIHLDPNRVLLVAKQLSVTLQRLDPTHRTHYQKQLNRFEKMWTKKINDWKLKAIKLRGKPIVVHHHSWIYLQDWTGLKKIATLEPKPGIPPTSSHLSRLVTQLSNQPAEVIIHSSYQTPRPAQWLSQKTGTPVLSLDFGPGPNETLMHWFDRIMNQLVNI